MSDLIDLENKEEKEVNNDNNEENQEDSQQTERRRSAIPQSVRRLGIPLPGMVDKSKEESTSKQSTNDQVDGSGTNDAGIASPYSQMNVNFGIRKFDGTNWLSWKNQMMGYLAVKQCDYCLRTPRPRTDTVMQAAFDDRERFARGMLICSMADKIVIMVAHLKTSREIWTRLVESYEQTSKVSAVFMQRKFFEATMEDNETAMEFVSRLQSIYCQLLETGSKMAEEMLVARIVAGLSSKFHVFITNWSNNTDLKQTLAELIPRLMSEEALLNRFKTQDGLAMVNEARRPKARSIGAPQSGRPQRDSTKPKQEVQASTSGRSGTRPNRGPKCYNCNVFGHISKNCPKPQKPRPNKPPATKTEEAIVAEGVVAEANAVTTDNRWIIDSGASDHMSYDGSTFVSLKPSSKEFVKVGDNGELSVEGVGEIRVRSLVDGESRDFTLKGVLYVPGLRRKLISLNVATSNGAIGAIESDRIVLSKGGRPLLVGQKSNGLYFVPLVEREHVDERETDQAALLNAETEENNEISAPDQVTANDSVLVEGKLWHERMAHISRATIARMQKLGSVDGLDGINLGYNHKRSDRKVINCESCCLAKHSRVAIPLSTRARATEVGERVHLDICGPVGAATVAGSKYFILFKDEYSNFRFIYFMKSREEAFSLIKRCFAEIETNPSYRVRTMVSDNGSEFTSNRTQEYLKEKSIVHVTSAPFTPQQNGFIERDNRTVMEACRSMLFHKRLPEMLWGEAAMTAVYVLNRTINVNTGDKTPFELFTGSKPRVSHMRVFGCVAFVKKQEKKRSGYQRKLDSRSERKVFVGYERDFTYKLFCPAKKSFMLSREVRFDEREDVHYFTALPQYANLDIEISNLRGSSLEEVGEDSDDELNVAEAHHDADEPTSYSEAIEGPQAKEWLAAMADEINSLMANETWSLVDLPPNKKAIKNRWIFKLKRDADGRIVRYKARLVGKGYSQIKGIDYTETHSPVVRMDSIRLILSIVAELDLYMIHFDIRTAFLYGTLDEEIYMTQPAGFESGDRRVCRLHKSLYGLKQASRVWNKHFVAFLTRFNLQPTVSDTCVLVRDTGDDLLIVALYVDDGLACSNNKQLLDDVVKYLKDSFEITLMQAECFVGIQIQRQREKRRLFINQSAFIDRLIPRFNLNEAMICSTPMATTKLTILGEADGEESKPVDVPYREIIGSLMYLAGGSRPDISNAVAVLARFCNQPRLVHWRAAKRILKYVVATRSLSLCYDGLASTKLIAYSDADYANCLETRRSMTGFVIMKCGAAVLWKSTKQTTVAESTVEAEFVACSLTSKDLVWCVNFLEELRQEVEKPVSLKSDNQGALRVIKNNQIHSKVKQLDIKMMAIREREERGQIASSYVSTNENIADILTKPLPPKRFNYLRCGLGLMAVMVLCIGASEAARINFSAKGLRSRPAQRLLLKISSPCSDSQEVEKSIYGKVDVTPAFKANLSFVESTKTYCDDMWNNKVTPAIAALDGCLAQHVISKRDLGTAINAAVLVANAVAGVTNLIRGTASSLSTESDADGQAKKLEALGKIVSESAKTTLLDQAIMKRETSQEVAIVSDTAMVHQDQVYEAVQSTPMLIWITGHLIHELQAGIANLKAIRRQCALGRLATQELGEMLECPALTAIPPDATTLERIAVDANNNTVEFIFKSEEVIELDIERLSIWTAVVVLVALLLCMLCLNLTTVRSIHKRSKANTAAQSDETPKSDSGSRQTSDGTPGNQLAAKISSSLLPLSRLAMEF